jgi:hydroxymethylbilane synthase
MSRPLRLGTRTSALARWQARRVAQRLWRERFEVRLIEITTSGDRDLARPIDDLPSDSPFTDDIEAALRAYRIDLAVHSLKDMALDQPDDLVTGAILERGDPRESLVSRGGRTLAELPPGATVGTSGLRRRAQILRLRPDLHPGPMRGAVDDRVRQVREGRFDAAVLAVAGLARLGLQDEVAEIFPFETFVPAPGQGALAVQARAGDERALRAAAALDDRRARRATDAERWLQRLFEPSNEVSLAAHASAPDDVALFARLVRKDGRRANDVWARGSTPERVADEAAGRLGVHWGSEAAPGTWAYAP